MSFFNHVFDPQTEQFAAPTLARIRTFAQETPLDGPLVVEIGTNRGRFLSAIAAENSDLIHLGIEIRRKYAVQAQKRCQRLGLDNVHVLCADANLVLPIIAKHAQIRTFFLICPDPWWKSRHEKRRILQPEFLDMLADKMEDSGQLFIRTDVDMLAEWMRNRLDEHPDFVPLHPSEYPQKTFPLSTRERHVIEYAMPIFPLYYRRIPRTSGLS